MTVWDVTVSAVFWSSSAFTDLVQNHHEKHSYFSYSVQNWWFQFSGTLHIFAFVDVINIASLQCRTLSESVNFEFVVLQPVNLSSCTGLISYNGLITSSSKTENWASVLTSSSAIENLASVLLELCHQKQRIWQVLFLTSLSTIKNLANVHQSSLSLYHFHT